MHLGRELHYESGNLFRLSNLLWRRSKKDNPVPKSRITRLISEENAHVVICVFIHVIPWMKITQWDVVLLDVKTPFTKAASFCGKIKLACVLPVTWNWVQRIVGRKIQLNFLTWLYKMLKNGTRWTAQRLCKRKSWTSSLMLALLNWGTSPNPNINKFGMKSNEQLRFWGPQGEG